MWHLLPSGLQVQELGKREQVLHKIAHGKGGSGGSARKPSPALAMLQHQARSKTPMLSPAGRAMLATKLKGSAAAGNGGGTPLTSERDDVLRASYRGPPGGSTTPLTAGRASTGSRPGSRASTPLRGSASKGTPRIAEAAAAALAKLQPQQGITDDLLRL